MDMNVKYVQSDEIVARDIEGELIIVPLSAGIGDMEDELFSLNDTGREIWRHLDGQHTLGEVVEALTEEYDAPAGEIEQDVLGLIGELLKRNMLRVVV